MASPETPLQIDLFTGEAIDTRTREQRQRDRERTAPVQAEMFSQRAVAQFGVTSRPMMPLSPGKLVLIREDPRTEEEIERDRLRAAEDQTFHLFENEPPDKSSDSTTVFTPVEMQILAPPEEDEEDTDELEDTSLPPESPLTKWVAYQALIAAIAEATRTLESSELVRIAQEISVSLATHNAKRAGLTEAEMTAARAIGSFRTTPQEPISPTQSDLPKSLETPTITSTSPEIVADDDIPILWVKRSDFVKRRPDLAAEIAQLKDNEVAFLAERLGDALEEFYWIQLNVVLSLLLDHQLALHLKVPKQKKTRKKKVQESQ